MMFLYIISMLAIVIQSLFFIFSVAAGLYYLAEVVEEYSVMTKTVVTWISIATVLIHIGLILFEDFPLYLNILGIIQQVLHLAIIKEFPVMKYTNVSFITACIGLLVQHYCAFTYFGSNYYNYTEVLGYFTVCLWLVPFALFILFSANDHTLPITGERQPLLGDNNVVTDYLSKRGRTNIFCFAKDSILPQRNKKAF